VNGFYKCFLVGYINLSQVLSFSLKSTSYRGLEAVFFQYSIVCNRLSCVRDESESVTAEMLCPVIRLV